MNGLPVHRPFWQRRLVTPFLLILILDAVLFVAYTVPRSLQERSLSSSAGRLREEVQRENQVVEGLRRDADTVQANARDSQRFYEQVVSGRDATLVASLEELGRLAQELGLRPGHRSFDQEPVKGAPLVRFVVNMPVSGTYKQLTSFLDRLERSPRFVTVDSIKLKEKKDEGQADLDIVISTYFRGKEGGG
jgi:Tfp pilus assembly protein PilO